MHPERVDVVLVRPSRPANVAAACRAMKNMGVTRLRLVGAPPVDRPEDRALAYGAWDVLDGAERHATLAEAVAGSTFVAGTSGRGGAGRWTPRRLAREGGARAGEGRTCLVFGPEATGLTRRELGLCHVVVHIPTHTAHASLNLAQAVLILAYEIRLSRRPDTAPADEDRAEARELEACLLALEGSLLAIGYLKPRDPGRILAEIRSLLARAGPTRRELTLLRGMARQIQWAGSVASRGRGSR
jgi:TrmH family RNA methyltransferase